MRGSLKQRYKGSWSIILDLGYQTDPETGKTKRKQKWLTFRGTKKQAQDKLADLLGEVRRGEFVAPSETTFGEWLDEWLDKVIKPARGRRTHETYRSVITNHLKPRLGAIPLQQLKAADLERYYAEVTAGEHGLSPATIEQHHTIVSGALKKAMKGALVQRNAAKLVEGKPQAEHRETSDSAWEAHEAKAFLAAAKDAGPQPAAFYALALDTGARKAELCGLKWTDADLATGRITIARQLAKPGAVPTFGPLKMRAAPRTIDLSPETIALLRRHRGHQAELKLRNGAHYRDHGLIFAREWGDLHRGQDSLGAPLQMNNLGEREFARIIKAAGVRRIKFHGLRHTTATLLLQAGVAPHVVQRRLGHKRIEITLGIYAHALPAQQQDAAERLAAMLH